MHHDTIKLRTIKPESQHHHKLIQAAQYLHEQTDATVTLAQLSEGRRPIALKPSAWFFKRLWRYAACLSSKRPPPSIQGGIAPGR